MTPPIHGGQLRHLAQTYNLDPATILDFSANINPEGPDPTVLAALHSALDQPETLTHYPDLDLTDLRQAITTHLNTPTDPGAPGPGSPAIESDRWGGDLAPETWVLNQPPITPNHIAIANGFVPLLEATIRTLHLTRTLLPIPCFSECRTTLERCHTTVIPHPLNLDHFAYDPDRISHDLNRSQADSLLLANPQNPSGVLTPASTLITLAQTHPTTTILVDEAFIDYVPHESLIPHLQALPNLVVFRSVTKFHAIPGLRIAYMAAHPATVRNIHHQLAPWPVSTLAAIATIAALKSTQTQTTIDLNLTRRTQLLVQLPPLGITCPEPAANFLLLRLPTHAPTLWQRLLTEHRILLRRCDNFDNLGQNHLRTAIRNEQDNTHLIAALATSLPPPPPSF